MWREVNNAIGAGTHDDDTERQYFYVLLKFKIPVERLFCIRRARGAIARHS
jgi:hypothetical protein